MIQNTYKRRQFIQTTATFSAGLAASLVYPHRTRAADEFTEAIVIGSGFGGAIAALRLGQSGINTLVIERGRRWPITPEQNTFATLTNPDGRSAWLSTTTIFGDSVAVYTGVFETLVENGITVVNGAGVGGGSLVYNAITYQPRRDIFYRVFSPSLVDYDELDAVYYPRVQQMLQASQIPTDILATNYYGKTRFYVDNANRAGLPTRLLDLAVNWDVVRQEINGTKVPSIIIGECWHGVSSGGKNSVDRNYLPQAEKTGFVEIIPLHIVTQIAEVPGVGYRISCTEINESGQVIREKSFTCRYLFLAAGSVGTSKLLVKAKAKGTLPRLNEHTGKYWGTNSDNLTTRSNLGDLTGNGGTAGAVIEQLDGKTPIVVMNLELSVNPNGVQSCLGLGIPQPRGEFKYNPATDSVNLYWKPAFDKTAIKRTEQLFAILDKTATSPTRHPTSETREGGMSVKKSKSTNQPSSETSGTISGHPLGGMVIGKACDPYGRVYGCQGLYVVDGALIPGSTACTNPSFTIAALAERCMDKIIAEDIKG